MSRTKKEAPTFRIVSGGKIREIKTSLCDMCGKHFKSHSHFDALCNLCWADNEMKPYFMRAKSSRGTGMAH